MILITLVILTMTHYNYDDHDDLNEFNDHDTYSLIDSSAPGDDFRFIDRIICSSVIHT